MKNDYILIFSAVCLLLLSGFVIFSLSFKPALISQKIAGKAVLTVDFGNGDKRSFEGEIIEGETVIDALTQASLAGSFSYKLDEKNNLASIGNFIKDNNKTWQWYLNEKKISEPLNKVQLNANDRVLIKYE